MNIMGQSKFEFMAIVYTAYTTTWWNLCRATRRLNSTWVARQAAHKVIIIFSVVFSCTVNLTFSKIIIAQYTFGNATHEVKTSKMMHSFTRDWIISGFTICSWSCRNNPSFNLQENPMWSCWFVYWGVYMHCLWWENHAITVSTCIPWHWLTNHKKEAQSDDILHLRLYYWCNCTHNYVYNNYRYLYDWCSHIVNFTVHSLFVHLSVHIYSMVNQL